MHESILCSPNEKIYFKYLPIMMINENTYHNQNRNQPISTLVQYSKKNHD